MNGIKPKQNAHSNNINPQEENKPKFPVKPWRKTYKLKEEEDFNKNFKREFTAFCEPEEFLPEWPSEEEIKVNFS